MLMSDSSALHNVFLHQKLKENADVEIKLHEHCQLDEAGSLAWSNIFHY